MNIPGAFANNNKYNLKEWTGKRGLERHKGEKWLLKGKIRIWSGKKWHCEHNFESNKCVDCESVGICKHKIRRSRCIECEGSSICEHNRIRSQCIQCGGASICEHNRQRAKCITCGGASICRICKSKRGNRKYDKLCVTCAIQEGYTVYRNYKTKELSMVEFITQHTDVDWINDKAYDLGCSKKRPDMVCDLGSHILIIECDENKHKNGNYSCENKRIMELSQDFSENNIHRPIVIIRFNPDTYIDSNNQKIESCWKAGKDDILRINNKENWDLRLNELLERTHHYIENKPIKDVTFEYLFYDDYTKTT